MRAPTVLVLPILALSSPELLACMACSLEAAPPGLVAWAGWSILLMLAWCGVGLVFDTTSRWEKGLWFLGLFLLFTFTMSPVEPPMVLFLVAWIVTVALRCGRHLRTRFEKPALDAAPFDDAAFEERVEAERQAFRRRRRSGTFHATVLTLMVLNSAAALIITARAA